MAEIPFVAVIGQIGLVLAPVALLIALASLLNSPAPPAGDDQAKARAKAPAPPAADAQAKTRAKARAKARAKTKGKATASSKATRKASPPAVTAKKVATANSNPRAAHPKKVAARNPQLFAFGATLAAWNVFHEEDERAAPGTAYDADPRVARRGDKRLDDHYYGVRLHSGRISAYSRRLKPGTSIQEGRKFVLLTEIPPDAKVVWFRRLDTCAQMLVRSETLARAGFAAVLFEFTSGKTRDTYDPRDVWDVTLRAWPLSGPRQAPACEKNRRGKPGGGKRKHGSTRGFNPN